MILLREKKFKFILTFVWICLKYRVAVKIKENIKKRT